MTSQKIGFVYRVDEEVTWVKVFLSTNSVNFISCSTQCLWLGYRMFIGPNTLSHYCVRFRLQSQYQQTQSWRLLWSSYILRIYRYITLISLKGFVPLFLCPTAVQSVCEYLHHFLPEARNIRENLCIYNATMTAMSWTAAPCLGNTCVSDFVETFMRSCVVIL